MAFVIGWNLILEYVSVRWMYLLYGINIKIILVKVFRIIPEFRISIKLI